MTEWIYQNCKIIRVVDADTFDILIDNTGRLLSDHLVDIGYAKYVKY